MESALKKLFEINLYCKTTYKLKLKTTKFNLPHNQVHGPDLLRHHYICQRLCPWLIEYQGHIVKVSVGKRIVEVGVLARVVYLLGKLLMTKGKTF